VPARLRPPAREGSVKLSPALNAHALIYQRRPDVNAVIHLHSHYVSVFSSLRRPVGMYNVTSVLFHESQALHVDDGTNPTRRWSTRSVTGGWSS